MQLEDKRRLGTLVALIAALNLLTLFIDPTHQLFRLALVFDVAFVLLLLWGLYGNPLKTKPTGTD